ncbi:hypothetical protein PV325_012163, partial [Microctonus aethiopoides]
MERAIETENDAAVILYYTSDFNVDKSRRAVGGCGYTVGEVLRGHSSIVGGVFRGHGSVVGEMLRDHKRVVGEVLRGQSLLMFNIIRQEVVWTVISHTRGVGKSCMRGNSMGYE